MNQERIDRIRRTDRVLSRLGCGLLIFALLVVAALLFPVIIRVREHNGRSCPGNLRQMGFVIAQYAMDNDGCLPNVCAYGNPRVTWRSLIRPRYIGLSCPRRKTHALDMDGLPGDYVANDSGLAAIGSGDLGRGALGGPGARRAVLMSTWLEPARLIMVCEATGPVGPDLDVDRPLPPETSSAQGRVLWTGHEVGFGGRASNCLMGDGHVMCLTWQQTAGLSSLPHSTQSANLWYRDGGKLSRAAVANIARADDQR